MNRRDFLDLRTLVPAVGPLVGAVEPEAEASLGPPVHLRYGRRAMATFFEVILPLGTPDAQSLAMSALDVVDRLETQLTVFHETSEVSRLNRRAVRCPIPAEAGLFHLLCLAKRLHAETDGAFDIAVGALVKTWGFFRRQGRVPSQAELTAVRERIGMQHVRLDIERQTVLFERQGLEINLGSIGKGYALDRTAALLRPTVRQALLHGGHSSILALGDEAPGKSGWAIGLLDPEQPSCRRAVIRLRDRGMATSAITYQHFTHDDRKLGHLLDPRTAWPAEGILSATATAPTAAEADALATAFFILGAEGSRTYCASHPEVGAVLITADQPSRLQVMGHSVYEMLAEG
jgi:thiamine biosynthesis lipoprotein